jgi:hypothetical protein
MKKLHDKLCYYYVYIQHLTVTISCDICEINLSLYLIKHHAVKFF